MRETLTLVHVDRAETGCLFWINGLINASTCYTILDTMPGSTIMMNAACTSSMCERHTCLKCT